MENAVMRPGVAWAPAVLLGLGAVFTVGVDLQRALPLRVSLEDAMPTVIEGNRGRDAVLSDGEVTVAGVTSYLLRDYLPPDSAISPGRGSGFSIYVGYYDSQMQGKTIHSPKNCLPGAGWQALASDRVDVEGPEGPVRVNRYLLENGGSRALVLYWYQGRGRVESNEYVVKWNLLRDAALRQRSDEALIRIVVPIRDGDADGAATALAVARGAASAALPAVFRALPG